MTSSAQVRTDARPIVEARGLHVFFASRRSLLDRLTRRKILEVHAVEDVDLSIGRGEIVALVGESGSGKSTLGRAFLRLNRVTAGSVHFDGDDITRIKRTEMRQLRQRAQLIAQHPHASLSPRQTVDRLLSEPYIAHSIPEDRQHSVADLLEMVELSPALANKYPHELSGGQARRVGIARALSLEPEFLVADEPTSGLDVSAAAKILTLLRDLRDERALTILIITHNLNIVEYVADRLAVMYLGRVFELGPSGQVLDHPSHPYTQALLDSVSEPDPTIRTESRRLLLPGEIPSPLDPPPGCTFHTRCQFAKPEVCAVEIPHLDEGPTGNEVACHFSAEAVRHWEESTPLQAGSPQGADTVTTLPSPTAIDSGSADS